MLSRSNGNINDLSHQDDTRELKKQLHSARVSRQSLERRVENDKWTDRVEKQPVKTFSSDHKILVRVLHTKVFISSNENEYGYYPIVIGKQEYPKNLRGMTGGLSHDKIGDMLTELVTAGFIIRDTIPGTREKNYKDTKTFIKPTDKWVPELFIIQKEQRYKQIHAPKCPHCGSENIITVCKDCGATFTIEEMERKQQAEAEAEAKFNRTTRGKTQRFYDVKALAPYEHEKEYDATPDENYQDVIPVENSTPDVTPDLTPIIDLQAYRIPVCSFCESNQHVELAKGHDYYVCSKCSHRVS